MKEGCKKVLFTVAVVMFLLGSNLYAQAPDTLWTKTYGGVLLDEGFSVQMTSDSGYVIAGYTRSFGIGPQEFYLVKTDADGDTNWTGTYGKGDIDCSNSVCETSDNGYIIAGYTDGTNGGDVYVVKTNAIGDTMWTKTYGGTSVDEGYSIQETYDGGYIIAGNTMSFGPSLFNVYLIKIDANGDTMWTGAYGGGFLRYCYSVLQTSDSSGYITAGILQRIGECPNACLTKIDTNGVVLWTKEYGGTEYDWSYSVQQTSDNGYIVTGFTESYGAGSYDVYLIKTDSIGDTMWTKTYGGAGDEEGLSVIETSDGGYLIAGYTDSFGAGYNDVYLIKTDADGDTIWTKIIGGTGSEKAYSVQEISEDEYIIAGSTSSYGAGFSDVYLIRMGRDKLAPEVQVSYPNGGEIFQPGDTCDIAWIATDNVGVDYVSIFYSINTGNSWDTIATGEPNDSLYEWIIPDTQSDSCLVKVVAYDTSLNVGEDESDSLFIIYQVGIEENIPSPVYFARLRIRPNPCKEKVEIKFQMTEDRGQNSENGNNEYDISLLIFDVTGRKVREISLLPFNFSLGATWDGKDDHGRRLPSGIYFCRLSTRNRCLTEKFLLLR